MRLIDANDLPVKKIGDVSVVLLDDINSAKTIQPKVIKVPMVPEKTIEIRWLQKRMMDAITDNPYSDEHLDSKYFCLINRFIAEYEEQQGEEKCCG